ncbi:MAG: ABC transporter ATP-binding protein [Anaerolineales bacterium]|nr:ABC transporter ATP-binding protein [Anaerolineales bacterium]
MNSNIVVKVENLGKQYKIGAVVDRSPTLRDAIVRAVRRPVEVLRGQALPRKEIIWALRNVSFEVERGKVLGIIGRNGAGKSTLLKVLSRITEPSEGYARITGRVGSLLEVGTGFNPELTGRENIFLNGAILGMRRSEIDRKFDEIVEFSGVEKFIETPVKRYSSGMYLRLAFSVAAHLEPEILVVDEVLAVGDAEFQRRCIGKMSEVAGEGRTVLFVSHNMSAVIRLTEESIVLQNGQMVYRAPTQEAVEFYMSSGYSQSSERRWSLDEIPDSAKPFRPIALRVKDPRGNIGDVVRSIEPLTVEMEYELEEDIQGLRVGIYLLTMRGDLVFVSFDTDSGPEYEKFGTRPAGRYVSRCQIPADFFNEGQYVIGINASSYRVKRFFQEEHALSFSIDSMGAPGKQWPEVRMGSVRPRLNWQIEEQF